MSDKERVLESFKNDPKFLELLDDKNVNLDEISFSNKSEDKFVEALKMLISSYLKKNGEQKILKDINQIIAK